MGRPKKVEGSSDMDNTLMEGVEIDVTPQEDIRQKIPTPKEEPVQTTRKSVTPQYYSNEPVNCLRDEKIIVRFVPSPTAMVQRKGHILFGGMAENGWRKESRREFAKV